MHTHTSIFTAEAYGILLIIQHIIQHKIQKSIVYTDSLSVVTALSCGKYSKNPAFNKLLNEIYAAYNLKLSIVICWVPGHSGIAGNEIVDKNAREAAGRQTIDITSVPGVDLKPVVRRGLRSHWQAEWDKQVDNKLHLVKPQLRKVIPQKLNRFTEVTLTRLRIGHTYATHKHLLTGTDPPTCIHCGESLTVLHVLIQCPVLHQARLTHFRELYRYRIPLHPALFLSFDAIFDLKRLLHYLAKVKFLAMISFQPSHQAGPHV